MAAGRIAAGDVDERSIVDVAADDLKGYTQCHFFAGIGVWSYALRRAGWPDDREVWTGSCPCQPFSAAGQQHGFDDERHLWPHMFRLIRERRPHVVFGEQVAAKIALEWLDTVSADLEGAGYAVGAVDTCAAGVGAPHIRQRLYWVARNLGNAADEPRERNARAVSSAQAGLNGARSSVDGCVPVGLEHASAGVGAAVDGVANAESDRRNGTLRDNEREKVFEAVGRGAVGELADTSDARHGRRGGSQSAGLRDAVERHGDADLMGNAASIGRTRVGDQSAHPGARQAGAVNGYWADADWLPCIDGKARPVEPGSFPLAHGAPARVGRLRAYGNAIVAPVAEEFIRAYIESVNA